MLSYVTFLESIAFFGNCVSCSPRIASLGENVLFQIRTLTPRSARGHFGIVVTIAWGKMCFQISVQCRDTFIFPKEHEYDT